MLDIHPSSFRDPAGFVFTESGLVKRAVRHKGRRDYDRFMSSGLYEKLLAKGWIVGHSEQASPEDGVYKVLLPRQLDYLSYPYEWCFDQIKDAALLTLEIQKLALEHGMSLKDASAFNVQFCGSRPVFIDTLSFETNGDSTWIAYGQYCRHFLAPLLLMSRGSPDWSRPLRAWLEGIPLDLASSALPWNTWLRPGPLIHLHLHSRAWKKYSLRVDASTAHAGPGSRDRKEAVADSLLSLVSGLKLKQDESVWSRYYREAEHYPPEAERVKQRTVASVLDAIRPSRVLDLGGNIGTYARIATGRKIPSVCLDFDPLCVNVNYRLSRAAGDAFMLPLVMDLTDPSPSLGFDSSERLGLLDRPAPDLTMALGIVHHLRIRGNIPLQRIARFLARLSPWLLIEFVSREDPKVRYLLRDREDGFEDYSEAGFIQAFEGRFERQQSVDISGTQRSLHLFRRRP